MEIKTEFWGTAKDGKKIYKYYVTNGSGAQVVLTSLGASIVSVLVPDKDGKLGTYPWALTRRKTITTTAHIWEGFPEGMPTGLRKATLSLTARSTTWQSTTDPTIFTEALPVSHTRFGTAASLMAP